MFSEKKKFNLGDPDKYKYYWHHLQKNKRILSRRQNGGSGVTVWGAFCERGVSSLAVLDGNQNATMYTKTLEQFLPPFARESDYSV